MENFDSVKASLDSANAKLDAQNLKLDEIKAFISTLQAGQVLTQAQLDELGALATVVDTKAGDNLAEADALDDPPTP